MTTGAGPSIDPIRYRSPQSRFDPGKFEFIGAVGRGGSMLVVSAAAEKRFYDRSMPPVAIGIAGSAPASGQLMAAWGIEFLGWNGQVDRRLPFDAGAQSSAPPGRNRHDRD